MCCGLEVMWSGHGSELNMASYFTSHSSYRDIYDLKRVTVFLNSTKTCGMGKWEHNKFWL